MIPVTANDLDTLAAEARRQSEELDTLFEGLDREELGRRPSPRKWSALGHVAHLCLVNDPYLEVFDAVIAHARAAGRPESDGPYRHPRIATWFARSMEPPPKRRMKTLKSMVPDPTSELADAAEGFHASQRRLGDLIVAARGLDLGRIRFGSPFMGLLRMSLGTGLETLLAHNRRHLWLIRETLGRSRAQEGAERGGPR